MLSKDELRQKQKTKRQARLVKHVANTLTTVMDNLVLSSSASNIDCDMGCRQQNSDIAKNQLDRCGKRREFHPPSTQVSSSHSNDSFTDAETHLPFPDTVYQRKSSKKHHNDKDSNEIAGVAAKSKNISSSDMRETSWVIPNDATTLMIAFSETGVSSGSSDRRDKKNSPKKHNFLSRYSQDSDSSDSHTFPIQSKPKAHITNIIKPAEQYFDTWYTDHRRSRNNKLAREKKKMKSKISSKQGVGKPLTNHKLHRLNNFQPKPTSKSHKSRDRHRGRSTINDSFSSDSENDLKFTTVVKRPQFSSSDEEYKDYYRHHHKMKSYSLSRNDRDSEFEYSDASASSDYSQHKTKTIGYLVRKPLAKLCMTDAGIILSSEKDHTSRNCVPSYKKGHANNNRYYYNGGEGDHHIKQKSYNAPSCPKTSTKRHSRQPKEQGQIVLMSRGYTHSSKRNEDQDSPVYVVRSHTNAKTNYPQKATKEWMSDRRSDKCRFSAVDKALCDLRKCLQKQQKKSEIADVSKKHLVSKQR